MLDTKSFSDNDFMYKTTTTYGEPLALTFDDVQIVPQYSEIESRSNVDTTTALTSMFHNSLDIPLIAAPMDTVCDFDMAKALSGLGGLGVIHRFMPISKQAEQVAKLADLNLFPVTAAVGVNDEERIKALVNADVDVLMIDVAHGHHVNVYNTIKWIKNYANVQVIAGSIATVDAAKDLVEWGADGLRVGVGGGSVCETRIRTGIGIPQFQAVYDICREVDVPVISDGGIRYPGDAAKALAAGADTVMIGSLFAGTDEAPGDTFVSGQWPNTKKMKVYRGLASATTKLLHKGAAEHVEGASKMIESKGSVSVIVNDIMDGIKSSMSYVGASNLAEFRAQTQFVRITQAGLNEAHPHLLR